MPERRAPRAVPRGPYTEWWWPDGPRSGGRRGWAGFEHDLVPEVDPGPESTYFWAHQFRLDGGEGGYLGLQTKGNRADGSLGKMAIFSLWDATGAEGPGVVRFSGEGTGWSARIPLLWVAGHTYRLHLDEGDVTPEGTWWAASVTDLGRASEEPGREQTIGRLRAAPGWGRLGTWSVMWTEYYGPPPARCDELPYVSAVFGTPRAGGVSAPRDVAPLRCHSHLGEGTCDTTRITEVDGGVRQEMGLRA